MKEFINVHCHLLNFKFVPDSFFKTRAGVREKLLRCKLTHHLARCLIFIFNLFRGPDKRYDKLHQVLAILNKDIHEVAKIFVDETKMKELEEAEIVLSTPLMMDLEIASLKMKPECPYRYQVKLISDIAIKYPGKIMPFIMVDPRRRLATELIVRALEEMGFLGVKMYPPLGYHPDPSSICNDDEINHELEKIYKDCEKNSIPITTQCSQGGAYSAV